MTQSRDKEKDLAMLKYLNELAKINHANETKAPPEEHWDEGASTRMLKLLDHASPPEKKP